MNIKDFLSIANVMIDFPSNDKASVLDKLARRAAMALDLSADTVAMEIGKRDQWQLHACERDQPVVPWIRG